MKCRSMYIWWQSAIIQFLAYSFWTNCIYIFFFQFFTTCDSERVIILAIKMDLPFFDSTASITAIVNEKVSREEKLLLNIFSFLSCGLRNGRGDATIVTGIAVVRRDERWPIVNQWIISSREMTVTDRTGINPRFYTGAMVHTKWGAIVRWQNAVIFQPTMS